MYFICWARYKTYSNTVRIYYFYSNSGYISGLVANASQYYEFMRLLQPPRSADGISTPSWILADGNSSSSEEERATIPQLYGGEKNSPGWYHHVQKYRESLDEKSKSKRSSRIGTEWYSTIKWKHFVTKITGIYTANALVKEAGTLSDGSEGVVFLRTRLQTSDRSTIFTFIRLLSIFQGR